jgi:4-hydroxybenzoyl-CoA thioesterase
VKKMTASKTRISVSFGDCDPAGIVFYPNILRWCDAAFHDHLRPFGGHAEICKQLHSAGIGLAESNARFRSPLRDGDQLDITTTIGDWGRRSVTMLHIGHVGVRVAFEVTEVRCLFITTETGMVAAEVGALRAMLQTGGA